MIAERLIAAREKTGLSQTEVAKRIGATQAAVSYFEMGLKIPSVPTLLSLARLYNVSMDYLVGNDGQANKV